MSDFIQETLSEALEKLRDRKIKVDAMEVRVRAEKRELDHAIRKLEPLVRGRLKPAKSAVEGNGKPASAAPRTNSKELILKALEGEQHLSAPEIAVKAGLPARGLHMKLQGMTTEGLLESPIKGLWRLPSVHGRHVTDAARDVAGIQ